MEYKYEQIFGDQSLFYGAPEDAVSVRYGKSEYIFDSEEIKATTGQLRDVPVVAMRRIIKTQVWTVADQQAGRLPEVGCKAIGLYDQVVTVTSVDIRNGLLTVQDENDQCISIYRFSDLKPIETPEERAQRLRDEWVNKAWSETAVFAGVTQDEHDRLRIHLRHIYRAQLSGELKAPGVE